MPAEVFLDAVNQATAARRRASPASAANARAVDLPHEGFGSYFLDTFDRPQARDAAASASAPAAPRSGQVLLLANSDEIENKIADGNGRVAKLFKEKKPTARDDRGTVSDGFAPRADRRSRRRS